MLHKEINHLCSSILKDIRTKISPDRRSILEAIAKQIDSELKIGNTIKLVYLCTHNSRRSHFSQVWGHVASLFFGFSEIETYSGGTVATACHPNTIEALRELGFTITCEDLSSENPNYNVFYAENDFIHCYSKANTDNVLPQSDFIAIMTCSDSDDNCHWFQEPKNDFQQLMTILKSLMILRTLSNIIKKEAYRLPTRHFILFNIYQCFVLRNRFKKIPKSIFR